MFLLLLNSICRQSRPFLLPIPLFRRLGVHRNLGGNAARKADPKWLKGMSYIIWCHGPHIKWGKRRKVWVFGGMVFVCPSHHYTWWHPLWLPLLECMAFALTTSQSTRVIFHFYFFWPLSEPTMGRKKQDIAWHLLVGLG